MKAMNQQRKIREGLVTFGVALFFVLAVISQVRVHIIAQESILKNAKNTKRFWVKRKDSAHRGTIYSSDGKVLAQSTDMYELGVDYKKVPKSPGFFLELASAAEISASELRQAAWSGVGLRFWNSYLHKTQAERVQKVKTHWNADGVSLNRVSKRFYPLAENTSGIIGYLRDANPVSGLELSKNELLSGKSGFREGLTDRTGAFLPMRMSSEEIKPEHGVHLHLTIDSFIQTRCTDLIRKAVESSDSDQGAIIVMDPKTGDVLTMANWPAWEPKDTNSFSSCNTDFNPCYMAAFEPGSTFKSLTLAKAIDMNITSLKGMLNCSGELRIGNRSRIRCHLRRDGRAHRNISSANAIARSCNVSAASWGIKIGYNHMVQYLEQLGLLSKSNLGLPYERGGMFNRNDSAKALQMANVGFGQSITATPIALANAFSILANDGVRMEPRIIKQVGDNVLEPKVAEKIISPEAARDALRAMELAVESDMGTARKLRIPGFKLAGKTGTAQRVNRKTGKLQGGGYIANFVGFVSSEKPKATVLVMLDNPKKGSYYGGAVAGPVFKKVAEEIIKHYNISPNKEHIK